MGCFAYGFDLSFVLFIFISNDYPALYSVAVSDLSACWAPSVFRSQRRANPFCVYTNDGEHIEISNQYYRRNLLMLSTRRLTADDCLKYSFIELENLQFVRYFDIYREIYDFLN